MALQIIRNNIVNVSADAIVNTANPNVAVGPGVDQAIYEAAGYDRHSVAPQGERTFPPLRLFNGLYEYGGQRRTGGAGGVRRR